MQGLKERKQTNWYNAKNVELMVLKIAQEVNGHVQVISRGTIQRPWGGIQFRLFMSLLLKIKSSHISCNWWEMSNGSFCGNRSIMVPLTVADPGFPVGGGGGADLRRVHFSAKTYAKMKEMDPVGGRRRRPPWIRQWLMYQYNSLRKDLIHLKNKRALFFWSYPSIV